MRNLGHLSQDYCGPSLLCPIQPQCSLYDTREQEETSHCCDDLGFNSGPSLFKLKHSAAYERYTIPSFALASQLLGRKRAHCSRLFKPQQAVDGTGTWPGI